MSAEFAKDVENKNLSLTEFAGAFFDASVRAPIDSARHQFGGKAQTTTAEVHSLESLESFESFSTKAGHLAGEAFDAMVVLAIAGKVLKAVKCAETIEHVAITDANNPISELGRKLPQYFKTLDAKEALLQATSDSGAQRALLKEQIAVKSDFSYDLMRLWQGTADCPGIVHYGDAQLAISEFPAARVAQIREALKLPVPEMSQSLFTLTFPQSQYDNLYDLSTGMARAKEKYFNYDLFEIANRMSMPEVHSIRDHYYDTPLSWMPTRDSSATPGFFHGTISPSLDSIIAEKSILPSNQLRARGIPQRTGETATQISAKDAVSITRDFKEAWAYHLTSPQYIDSYPVVFGVSRQAASIARLAGPIEPGEILIDHLHLDETLFGKLERLNSMGNPFGQAKPFSSAPADGARITHMYVPDMKVAETTQKLKSGRIRGVSVSGFSELKTPEWTDEPPLSEAELW
jgi:hypothetical protein